MASSSSATLPSPVASGPARPRRRWGLAPLRGDGRGIAALELAIIAPVLVTAALGLYSTVQAVRVKLLLNSAASSMALLVATQDKVVAGPGGNLTDMCSNGAKNSLLPYNPAPVSMTIARYSRPPTGNVVSPDWQRFDACPTSGAAPMGTNEALLANTLLLADGDIAPAIIMVNASYVFQPSISFMIPPFTISTTRYEKARNVGKAACSNC